MKRIGILLVAMVLAMTVATPAFAKARCFACSSPSEFPKREFYAPKKVIQPGSDFGNAVEKMGAALLATIAAIEAPSPATIGAAGLAWGSVIRENPRRPIYGY